ncbi:STAS domain-containing protein [Metabacillus litoralis]|uniref:STAS domain-containing protein n=1 Tax=Metabacillus TaxID=2675233 RepID=UPI000EF5FB97|nr:STAS domain-containing protein [Metabacillus litoralis]MCM3162000.1 STAS domain-containing protein [Metabacillus litoralis]MCM3411333.1 STAS domain-containing protein [Metabacillus litoralis]UHA60394.1 STAS domain-containing protein [Metabacillus litoralis]
MNKEYVEKLETKVKEYEEAILDMSAPIIPSIVPDTILVPITGILLEERFEKIRIKILSYIQTHDIETAIIDMTDITLDKIEQIGMRELGNEIHQLTDAIFLMGVEPYYVGLSPQLIKEIVSTGVQIKAESFSTFQSALKHLMKKKGIVLQKASV